jgi:hypothetical protein
MDEQLCRILQLQILRAIPLLHVRGLSLRFVHFNRTFLLRPLAWKVRWLQQVLFVDKPAWAA